MRYYTKAKTPSKAPFTNTFFSILNARIEYTGIERSLSLSDSIFVQFGLVDVVPELAIGGFGQKNYVFNESKEISTFKDIYGKINLEDVHLDLSFENSFGIEALIKINDLEGINSRTGQSVKLSSSEFGVPFYLQRGVNITPGVRPFMYNVKLNKSNSNIKLFFENLPDQIKPSFEVSTEPYWHNNFTDFAFYDSYLKVNLDLLVPLDLGITDLKLIKESAFNFDDPDLVKVKSGNFKMKVENAYPWNVNIQLEFLDETGNILGRAGEPSDWVLAGIPDPLDPSRIEAKESLIQIPVSEELMTKIKTATQVRVISSFYTDQGQRYKIYSNYSMSIRLIADFVYEN